LAVIATLPVP